MRFVGRIGGREVVVGRAEGTYGRFALAEGRDVRLQRARAFTARQHTRSKSWC
jgi:hypothetical protein